MELASDPASPLPGLRPKGSTHGSNTVHPEFTAVPLTAEPGGSPGAHPWAGRCPLPLSSGWAAGRRVSPSPLRQPLSRTPRHTSNPAEMQCARPGSEVDGHWHTHRRPQRDDLWGRLTGLNSRLHSELPTSRSTASSRSVPPEALNLQPRQEASPSASGKGPGRKRCWARTRVAKGDCEVRGLSR